MPMLPCKPAFQVIESECDGENLEILSMESTVLSMHYVLHTVWLEIFEDKKFRGFRGSIMNLENFILKNFNHT